MIQGINARDSRLVIKKNSSDKVSLVRAIESCCGFIWFMDCTL